MATLLSVGHYILCYNKLIKQQHAFISIHLLEWYFEHIVLHSNLPKCAPDVRQQAKHLLPAETVHQGCLYWVSYRTWSSASYLCFSQTSVKICFSGTLITPWSSCYPLSATPNSTRLLCLLQRRRSVWLVSSFVEYGHFSNIFNFSASWLRDQADHQDMMTFTRSKILKITGSNSKEEKQRVLTDFSSPQG